MMAVRCMRDVDYGEGGHSGGAIASAPLSPRADDKSLQPAPKYVYNPQTKTIVKTGHFPQRPSGVLEKESKKLLRTIIIDQEQHSRIPDAIANWPTETLKLCDVVSPEECSDSFNDNLDALWTLVLQGLFLMTERSHLRCLDFSNFVPTKGVYFLLLHVAPLLTLPEEKLHHDILYQVVLRNLGIQDEVMTNHLKEFLVKALQHKVFHRKKRILIPRGQTLRITLDHVPLVEDKMTLMLLLTCFGLQSLTQIHLKPRSLELSLGSLKNVEFVSEPLSILLFLEKLSLQNSIQGLNFRDALAQDLGFFLSCMNNNSCFQNLAKLCLENMNLNIQDSATVNLQPMITDWLSRFRCLNRLNLSFSDLRGSLQNILENLESPLEYLDLTKCCLLSTDIEALSKSHHCENLIEVRLCELCSSQEKDATNSKHIAAELTECVSCLNSVAILDLRNNNFSENMNLLEDSLRKLGRVQDVCLEGVPLADNDIVKLLQMAQTMPKLKQISVTRLVDAATSTDIDDELWESLQHRHDGTSLNVNISNYVGLVDLTI